MKDVMYYFNLWDSKEYSFSERLDLVKFITTMLEVDVIE